MLSFTPGFLFSLWGELEKSLFQQKKHIVNSKSLYANAISGDISDGVSDGRQKRFGKDTGYKWANVLQKITGKAPTENVFVDSVNSSSNFSQTVEDPSDKWDIEPLRRGPEGISRDIACLLLLFCSTYSHLLLILDDIEFYEKQVPFTLEQQQKIASMVNTLVYNSLSRGVTPQHRAIVDSAVRCLHFYCMKEIAGANFVILLCGFRLVKITGCQLLWLPGLMKFPQAQMEQPPQAWVPSLLLCHTYFHSKKGRFSTTRSEFIVGSRSTISVLTLLIDINSMVELLSG
ncbi:UNVERIFIED_CONTAM: E3 ubiquitin-protein ligase UPL7 [Sesamum angustifolium]|uniref:HECT-type E3 ubiquitin transferase n=1 Tax=Sesamum angustifolium TaxID=2727405 RepID=A0AAW2MTM9_9LAMI